MRRQVKRDMKTAKEQYCEKLIKEIDEDPLQAARILRQYAIALRQTKKGIYNNPFAPDIKSHCMLIGAKAIEKLYGGNNEQRETD